MAEFIDSSSYNNSLIQKFLCLGLWDQFSVNVQRNVAPIYLGYQAFIGELDERLSITVYYEFVDRVRLYLYQDKDFAWKISVVWSSWSLNAGIIELLTTKRLSKQPLKLYQFYTTRIKKKYGGRIKDIVEPLLHLLKENWRGHVGGPYEWWNWRKISISLWKDTGINMILKSMNKKLCSQSTASGAGFLAFFMSVTITLKLQIRGE